MDESEKIRRNEFRSELMALADTVSGNKPETVKRKIGKVWDKYEQLISYSIDDKKYYHDKCELYAKVINCLRSGLIEFKDGFVLISEVESMKKDGESYVLKTKSGDTVRLSKDFDYLPMVFSKVRLY